MAENIELYHCILNQTASPEQLDQFRELMNDVGERITFERYKKVWTEAPSVKGYRKYNEKRAFLRITQILHNRRMQYKANLRIGIAGIAAGIIFMLVLANLLKINFGAENKSSVTFQTQIGNKSLLILPDSSKVWLNSCTSIRYDRHFNKRQRDVYISGECYFEVSRSKKPFVVHANELSVRVYGTHFNVSAYPDEEKIETSLESGKIGISHSGQQEYFIKPGQMVVYNKQTTRFTIHTAPVAEYSAWRNDKMYLHNESLSDLAEKLKRQYGIQMRFQPLELGDRVHYTGVFGNENLIEILQAISVASGVKVTKENSEYILSKQ